MNPVIAFLMWSASFSIPMSAGAAPPIGAEEPKSLARVKVDITAGAEIKRTMHAYVAQSFQSLGGVQLVEDKPQWTIKIVTLTAQDDAGNTTAIGLSVVTLEHGPQMDMLRTLVHAWHYIIKAGLLQKDQPLEVGMRQLVAGIDRLPATDDLAVLSQHRMCLIPLPKLGEACHDIVVNFNNKFLRPPEAGQSGVARQPDVPSVPAAPQ